MLRLLGALLLMLVSVLAGTVHAAVITADAAGGNWTTGATWIGGAAPTAADDAVLAATSGNVTVTSGAVARSLDATSYLGILTHSASVTLTLGDGTAGAGNIALRLGAGMTYTVGGATTSIINYISTSATQQTIDYAGKTVGAQTFNATSNGSWQLVSALTMTSATLTLTKGTLDLNGQTINANLVASNSGSVRSLTCGAAAITLAATTTAWNFAASNLTLSCASSTITLTGGGAVFTGAGGTYGTVVFSAAIQQEITDSNTFSVLTRTGTAAKTNEFRLRANQTVTGTLNLNGNSAINRMLVRSDTLGTARTITNSGATMSWSNVDFRDITLGTAFDASAITGNSGDCLGNTNITFTTAATQTATGTASFTWSTHGWTSRVPLCQDNVVINNAFIAGRTVTLDMPRAGKSIDWTGATGTPAWSISTTTEVYGSITKISAMTQSGTSQLSFMGRSSQTLTTAGVSWPNTTMTVSMVGGTLTLADNFICTCALTHANGTFNDGGFAVEIFVSFTSNSGLTRALTMAGTWTMTGTGTKWTVSSTGLTLTATGSTIVINDTTQGASKVFTGGG